MPALSKLFQSILETRLSYKSEVCIDDDPCQAGFKRNSRTIDNIFILQSLVVSQKAHKKTLIYACYIDFTKAFDYVNRDALVFKLKKRFVNGNFLSVLQGCVLGPKIFAEFLCDISEYLDRSLGVKLGGMVIMYLLSADDIVLFRTQPKDYRNRSHYFGATVNYGNK